ncbi:hypothetical protein T492DRAFT_840976 [Pavlovales sp. CCMP2436]|nr:hypothetical protein T492DRAFT_840976 [Pavlovales sp. CCMP2436]
MAVAVVVVGLLIVEGAGVLAQLPVPNTLLSRGSPGGLGETGLVQSRKESGSRAYVIGARQTAVQSGASQANSQAEASGATSAVVDSATATFGRGGVPLVARRVSESTAEGQRQGMRLAPVAGSVSTALLMTDREESAVATGVRPEGECGHVLYARIPTNYLHKYPTYVRVDATDADVSDNGSGGEPSMAERVRDEQGATARGRTDISSSGAFLK